MEIVAEEEEEEQDDFPPRLLVKNYKRLSCLGH